MNVKRFFVLILALSVSSALPWQMGERERKVFGFTYDLSRNGIVITGVLKNSPAHKAKLEAGDRILTVDGETVKPDTFKKRDPLKTQDTVNLMVEQNNGTKRKARLTKVFPSEFAGPRGVEYAGPPLRMSGYRTGDVVSNIDAVRFSDGSEGDLYGMKAKVKLVNFWASWCQACNHEIPVLKRIRETYSEEDLAMIGVSLDTTRLAMSDFVEYKEMDWYHFWAGSDGNSDFHRLWEVRLIPINVILNENNEILEVVQNDSELEERLGEYLGE